MSHRKAQIESTLKRAIAQVLTRHLHDPRVQGMVSITQVDCSPDFHEAVVSVSILPQEYEKRTLAGLRHAVSHIHTLVCKQVAMRSVPHLIFKLDQGIKKGSAVLDALARAAEKTGPQAMEGAKDHTSHGGEPAQGATAAAEDQRS